MGKQNRAYLMRYGFVDESGDVNPFSGSRFLVVTALVTCDARPIELHVKRAREKLGRRALSNELKATSSTHHVVERLLRCISEEEVVIVTVVFDKRTIRRPPEDNEEVYRVLVTRTIVHCVQKFPRIELWLDKRYTTASLRYDLERTIREGIAGLPQQLVLIRQEDSRNSRALQAVDQIAWAIFQKYEVQDERFYQIIKPKVIVEELLERPLWK